MNSAAIEPEQFWSTAPLVADEDGLAAFSASYKGELRTFSTVAIGAMFLTKLVRISLWHDCEAKVKLLATGQSLLLGCHGVTCLSMVAMACCAHRATTSRVTIALRG
jgi:hypothetical protein